MGIDAARLTARTGAKGTRRDPPAGWRIRSFATLKRGVGDCTATRLAGTTSQQQNKPRPRPITLTQNGQGCLYCSRAITFLPTYGTSAAGSSTVPSGRWPCSIIAAHMRGVAKADPLR